MYIFNLDLTPELNRLRKDNCKTRRETFKFCDLGHLHYGFDGNFETDTVYKVQSNIQWNLSIT